MLAVHLLVEPACLATIAATAKEALRLSGEFEVGILVTIEGKRPVTGRPDQRQERQAGGVVGRLAPGDTGRYVEPLAARITLYPTARGVRDRVAPVPDLDRYFGFQELHEAGRIRKRGSRVIGEGDERAAQSRTARAGIRKTQLEGNDGLLRECADG